MARKSSNIFLAAFKRAARLQRRTLKLVTKPALKKSRKPVKKTAVKRPPMRRPKPPAATPPHSGGKGTWQNHIHHTAPSGTELLGRLAYALYRPSGSPIAGLPLVIMLHGCQQTACDMALGSGMNRLADQKGFVVAYPQQAKRVQAMRCWRWFQPDAAHGLAEADAIADLAITLVRKYRLDPARVYVAGLSAGASMAALLVLRHPVVFVAAALHSGAVVGAAHDTITGLRIMRQGSSGDPDELIKPLANGLPPFQEMPVIILHGKKDRVVSMRNATQLAQQFSYVNRSSAVKEAILAQGTHREYFRRDFLNGRRVDVRLCLLKEVGHAWSGGDSKLKFNSKNGPRASLLIWQFFAMHSRSQPPLK